MRFLALQTGVHVNVDAIEAVLVGDRVGNEWPVTVRTAGNEYLDHQAPDSASAHLAVELIVADLTGTQRAKIGETAECIHCGTTLKYVPVVEWVHVLTHSDPARGGCVKPEPKRPSPIDDELASLLESGNGEGGGA